MGRLKLRSRDLEKIGYPKKSKALGYAINTMLQHHRNINKPKALQMLKDILEYPNNFKDDPIWAKVAIELGAVVSDDLVREVPILYPEEQISYKSWGSKNIQGSAKLQMNLAMRLPISIGGALMPDAHHGYGLPIGGVLATDNAVIPYGVGMDIGCRMCLSIFDLPAEFASRESYQLTEALKLHTRFGDKQFDKPISDDPIFVRHEFKEIPFVRKLKDKAYKQLGSSGSGNHFVEFGIVEITDQDNEMGLDLKRYFALLSHSGSRGFGANIARHYTDIAKERCLLPNEAKHLAWLSLNTEAGMEYWLAMNLAGDYASACHHQIHKRMYRFLGEEPLAVIENHHNFAWKQTLYNGKEVIVHRKGATPANKGELGIIPGSMTAPGFIVRGKGNPQSLNSAAHGAGRAMSRTKAKNSFTNSEMRKHLKQKGVKLIGGAIDESPFAYKDIHQVMQAQTDLVDVLGSFTPKIVRMDRR